jgi:hypothetical protein
LHFYLSALELFKLLFDHNQKFMLNFATLNFVNSYQTSPIFIIFPQKLSGKFDTSWLLKAALFWRQHALKPKFQKVPQKISEEFDTCCNLSQK